MTKPLLWIEYHVEIITWKTWNPFLWLWWRVLWCWLRARGTKAHLVRPGVLEIKDNSDLAFTGDMIGNGVIDITGSSSANMSEVIDIINSSAKWRAHFD